VWQASRNHRLPPTGDYQGYLLTCLEKKSQTSLSRARHTARMADIHGRLGLEADLARRLCLSLPVLCAVPQDVVAYMQ
jgi:hypothetical protein